MLHRRRHEQATIVEPVTAAVQTISKPAYLTEAEQRLVDARAIRDAKARVLKAAYQDLFNSPTLTSAVPASVRQLEREREEAEGRVREAREAVAVAREKFAPTFASTVQPGVDLALEELSAISVRAQAIAESLTMANDFALRSGLTVNGPVSRALSIREAARWLTNAVRG